MIQRENVNYLSDSKKAPHRQLCTKVLQVAGNGRWSDWNYETNQDISPRQKGENQNADVGFNYLKFKRWEYEPSSFYGMRVCFHSSDEISLVH